MAKSIRHEFASFDAEYFKKHSEEEFIKDQFASVPDNVGSDEQKKAWLREAYAKVVGKTDKSEKVKEK